MARLRAPRSAQAADEYARLAALWREGLARNHDPGCGCGGMFAPALDAQNIEADFIGYLAERYARENAAVLEAFVAERSAALEANNAVTGLDAWIASLPQAPLSMPQRERLLADISTFVESLAGAAQKRPGICI